MLTKHKLELSTMLSNNYKQLEDKITTFEIEIQKMNSRMRDLEHKNNQWSKKITP